MICTYIIGTGFLSDNLKKKITNSEVYSALDFIKKINIINKKNKKINIIINSFFSTNNLNQLSSYEIFSKKTIFDLSRILDLIDSKIINKIIYTSSSSIYGLINNNIDYRDDNNRKIYAGFKIASEFLIRNYCNKNFISLNICRVFNLYGKNNNFSIIEKLKQAKKKNYKIKIYNQGLSSRDFIHIDDVVKIYKEIILNLSGSNLYDIGTGKSITVRELINKLKITNIEYKKKKTNEIFESIADNRDLLKKIKNFKFKKVENYLGIKKPLISKKIINKNYIENNIISTLIYGAGYYGKKIEKLFSALGKSNISYFIDDDLKKVKNFINGIEVISFKDFQNISYNSNIISNVIIAIPSLTLKNKIKLIKKIKPYCDSISSLSNKNFIKNNHKELKDVKDIPFDKFLGKVI